MVLSHFFLCNVVINIVWRCYVRCVCVCRAPEKKVCTCCADSTKWVRRCLHAWITGLHKSGLLPLNQTNCDLRHDVLSVQSSGSVMGNLQLRLKQSWTETRWFSWKSETKEKPGEGSGRTSRQQTIEIFLPSPQPKPDLQTTSFVLCFVSVRVLVRACTCVSVSVLLFSEGLTPKMKVHSGLCGVQVHTHVARLSVSFWLSWDNRDYHLNQRWSVHVLQSLCWSVQEERGKTVRPGPDSWESSHNISFIISS